MFTIDHLPRKLTHKQIVSILKKQGYRQTNNGSFSSVWTKEGTDVVFKLGKVETNEPYLKWLEQLSKAQPTKYEPVIHRAGIFGKWFVVSMEKLESYEPQYWDGDRFVDMLAGVVVDCEKLSKEYEELRPVIIRMRRAQQASENAQWDFHEFNVMLRGEHHVIIDPLYDPRYL